VQRSVFSTPPTFFPPPPHLLVVNDPSDLALLRADVFGYMKQSLSFSSSMQDQAHAYQALLSLLSTFLKAESGPYWPGNSFPQAEQLVSARLLRFSPFFSPFQSATPFSIVPDEFWRLPGLQMGHCFLSSSCTHRHPMRDPSALFVVPHLFNLRQCEIVAHPR